MESGRLITLWQEVIAQAWRDAMRPEPGPGYRQVNVEEWRQARLFLTAERGVHAKGRRDVCAIVDMCPDRLRRIALRMIEEIDNGRGGEGPEERRRRFKSGATVPPLPGVWANETAAQPKDAMLGRGSPGVRSSLVLQSLRMERGCAG